MRAVTLSKLTGVLLVVALIMASVQAAAAHIFDQYEAGDLAPGYGSPNYGYAAEMSYGELTFVDSYPDPGLLTDAEICMLAGTANGPVEFARTGFPSWQSFVTRAAIAYWCEYGTLPEQLTPEVYAAAFNKHVEDVSPTKLEMLKSPLTGEYPYLNSSGFSPGNMYIKILTEDEKWHFAQLRESYYECWYNSRMPDPRGGYVAVELDEPVYYVRMYGWNEVLENSIRFSIGPSR